jgi:hypothetical protein
LSSSLILFAVLDGTLVLGGSSFKACRCRLAGVGHGLGDESLGTADCQDYPMLKPPVSFSIARF